MKPAVRTGAFIGGGAMLMVLIGFIGSSTERPSEPALIFTLVPSTGVRQDGDVYGSERPQSHVAVLNLQTPQERPRILTEGFFTARMPAVSYDGQWVLFTGKRSEADAWRIWEQQVDGTGLRQVTQGAREAIDPCYLPDGRIVFSGIAPDHQGQHALFTCRRDGSLVRRITFGHSDDRKPTILPDGRILFRQVRSGGADSLWMTIRTDGTGLQRFYGERRAGVRVISQRASATRTYGIYEFDAAHHQVGRLLYRDADADALDPMLALSHPRPRALTTVVDEAKQTGRLLCLNVYLSRIPEMTVLKAGEITKAQIVAVRDDLQERPVIEAEVEEDGSFYVEVPADTPLRLRLLGRDGRMVAALNSEIWVRPNEIRGCIGCHEDPELAPENRIPLAVTKPRLPAEFPMEKSDANQE